MTDTTAIQNEALEDMTVEEIMSLGVDQINELKFVLLPKGLYGGTLVKWDLPDEDNNQSWVPHIDVTSVIELLNAEEPFELPADTKLSTRYGKAFQGAIRAMRTNWDDLFRKVGGGIIGNAMANGNGTQIIFKVDHRVVKDKDTKEVKTFTEIKDVKVAS